MRHLNLREPLSTFFHAISAKPRLFMERLDRSYRYCDEASGFLGLQSAESSCDFYFIASSGNDGCSNKSDRDHNS